MSNKLKCTAFRGSYLQWVGPIFGTVLLLVVLVIFAAMGLVDRVWLISVGSASLVLLLFLVGQWARNLAVYLEIDGGELKFFDSREKFQFSILFRDILNARPKPFFSFDRAHVQLDIRLKQGSALTVLIEEERLPQIEAVLKEYAVFDSGSLKRVPLYMHLLFVLFLLLLLALLYMGLAAKEAIGLREIALGAVLVSFIWYYVSLRRR